MNTRMGSGFDGAPGSCRWPVIVVTLVSLGVLVAGCASPQRSQTVEMSTDIVVSEQLNPDANGRPSPLMLAVYQLRSADAFLSKDFFSVFDPEGAALGEDVIKRDQLTLQPGGNRSFEAEFDRDASFIGVVGAFSDLDRAQWRSVVEVPEKSLLNRMNLFGGERLRITVGERSVALSIGEG